MDTAIHFARAAGSMKVSLLCAQIDLKSAQRCLDKGLTDLARERIRSALEQIGGGIERADAPITEESCAMPEGL